MGKTIPYVGEFFNSQDFPAPVRVAHVSVGPATTNDVVVTAQGVYNLFTVPAGCIVHELLSLVTTAFTATLTATVGDTDSVAGYLGDTNLAPLTAVSTGVMVSSKASAQAYANGKHYAAAQAINIVTATADAAIGKADVYLLYSMAPND